MTYKKRKNKPPLLYALDQITGKLVSIDEVRPKHTDLICPSADCQWPLSPVVNTEKKIKHFRHKADRLGERRECSDTGGAKESIIHKLAKRIILKRKSIYLFPYVKAFGFYKNKRINSLSLSKFFDKGTRVNLTEIEEESRRIAPDYQPDVVAKVDDEEFIIELHYTHLVDDDKKNKIIRDGIAAIEISLDNLREAELSVYEIERAILNPDNFKWIHFPERWLTEKDFLTIKRHESSERKRIDADIEKEKVLEEKTAKEAKKKEELERVRALEEEKAREESARYMKVLENDEILSDYMSLYLEYLLDIKNITPYSDREQHELRKILPQIDRAYSILYKQAKEDDPFLFIPNKSTYKKIIGNIRDSYRKNLALAVLRVIKKRSEWVEKHLMSLSDLGLTPYDRHKLMKFDEVAAGHSYSFNLYIEQELLPESKVILDNYLKNFVG